MGGLNGDHQAAVEDDATAPAPSPVSPVEKRVPSVSDLRHTVQSRVVGRVEGKVNEISEIVWDGVDRADRSVSSFSAGPLKQVFYIFFSCVCCCCCCCCCVVYSCVI